MKFAFFPATSDLSECKYAKRKSGLFHVLPTGGSFSPEIIYKYIYGIVSPYKSLFWFIPKFETLNPLLPITYLWTTWYYVKLVCWKVSDDINSFFFSVRTARKFFWNLWKCGKPTEDDNFLTNLEYSCRL